MVRQTIRVKSGFKTHVHRFQAHLRNATLDSELQLFRRLGHLCPQDDKQFTGWSKLRSVKHLHFIVENSGFSCTCWWYQETIQYIQYFITNLFQLFLNLKNKGVTKSLKQCYLNTWFIYKFGIYEYATEVMLEIERRVVFFYNPSWSKHLTGNIYL